MSEGSILPVSTDPLSQVYSDFCDALFSHPLVAAAVRPGNRIRFDGKNPEPMKYNKSTADCPELSVHLQSYSGGSQKDANRQDSTITFMLRVDSGEQRANRGVLPVWYACIKALVAMRGGRDPINGKDIGGEGVVVRISQAPEGFATLTDMGQTDGIKSWSSYCRVILTLRFGIDNMP